jgi:hypothetical protein
MHEILKRMEMDEQAATQDKFLKNKKLVAREFLGFTQGCSL